MKTMFYIAMFAFLAVGDLDGAEGSKLLEQSSGIDGQNAKVKNEGPFGLAMGISVTDLTGVFGFVGEKNIPYIYSGVPPKPVLGFDDYHVTALPKTGVCKVSGLQTVDNVNSYGDEIKKAVDKLVQTLSIKYGKQAKKYDYAKDVAFKRHREYWMLGLKDELVVYAYNWVQAKNERKFPNNIYSISVEARAYSLTKAAVMLTYEFENVFDCMEDMKRLDIQNL